MTSEPPKRRGRPPGSPNKAKTSPTIGGNLTVLKPGEPVPWDQAGYVESVEVHGPDPIRVLLVTKRSFSTPADEREVDWPPEWRLPQAGESIRLNKDYAGFVEYIDWDLERKIVVAKLR